MARIFISYSRKDAAFARQLATDLDALGGDIVWIDVEDIPAGVKWIDAIQDGLDACDVMILIITPDAMRSANVADEWQYYLDNRKPVIPVWLKPATVHFRLNPIQRIDFHTQKYDTALAQLHAELRRKGILLTPQISMSPGVSPQKRQLSRVYWAIGAVVMIGLIGIVAVLLLNGSNGNNDKETPTATTQAVAQVMTEPALDASEEPTTQITSTPTITPSATSTLSPTEEEATIQVLMNGALTESALTADAAERLTQEAITATAEMEAAAFTASATLWTLTPTPDLRGTANARLTATQDVMIAQATQNAVGTETQNAVIVERTQNAKATITQAWIDSWTDTPTPTLTPSMTPTSMDTPIVTPSPTPIPASSINKQVWPEPTMQPIDGVEMVYVPAGCFIMGSNDEQIDYVVSLGADRSWSANEQPPHEVCLDGFWMDRTEVTNGQFVTFNGQAASESEWTGENRPREQITWFEAQAFCESRGARLPTEAEWEYAARGPEGLIYPWGNEFIADNAVYEGNSGNQTADVGSKPGGVSWVGAVDLSGNVWEWVADWYDEGYYATLTDGTDNPLGPANGEAHVLRGGSWANYDIFVQRGGSWLSFNYGVHAADRYWNDPDIRDNSNGFRCALSR